MPNGQRTTTLHCDGAAMQTSCCYQRCKQESVILDHQEAQEISHVSPKELQIPKKANIVGAQKNGKTKL